MLHVVAVGIDAYADQKIRPLKCAAADATSVAALFENGIVPEECEVHLLKNEQATRAQILNIIGEEVAGKVERDDAVLFYFACHGSPEKRSPLDRAGAYLIAHDTRFESIYSTAIDLELDVRIWFDRLKHCKLTVGLFDSCFSGIAGGRTFEGPRLSTAISGGLRGFERVSLKNLSFGRGQVVIAASGSDEVAREDPARGHGIFTSHLLRLLQTPERDDPRSSITVGSLYDHLHDAVTGETRGAQTPTMRGDVVGARLPIVRSDGQK